MAGNHGPWIKDDELYESLRDKGMAMEKAARIANVRAAGTLEHKSTRLEDRTADELYEEARVIGIQGRSMMDKDELIRAIRAH